MFCQENNKGFSGRVEKCISGTLRFPSGRREGEGYQGIHRMEEKDSDSEGE